MKDIRLALAIPSTNVWEAEFGMSLVFLTNYLASHAALGTKSMQYMVLNKRGSILANMRQWLVQDAVEHDATHLLFIDSDQTFPKDAAHRLLARGKQVVACNIVTKTLPASPTARLDNGTEAGELLYTREDSTELVEVWRVGTGIMLLDLNIFKREGLKEGDWFPHTWLPHEQGYRGEDWGFCSRLHEAGVKIYVDQEVSREIGHVGKLNYGHDMVLEAAE